MRTRFAIIVVTVGIRTPLQSLHSNPSTDKIKWEPIQEKFPIDFLRIGNCNLDNCEPFKVTLSEMQTGFFEKDFEFLEEFFKNCDIKLQKTM